MGCRLARVLDYSQSGIRLSLTEDTSLRPGERLEIHHPGTNASYVATVTWLKQKPGQTIIGARLTNETLAARQAC